MYLSPENISELTEAVVFDSKAALQAHKDLFRFNEQCYISSDNHENVFPLVAGLVDACNASESYPSRIHLAAGWENMLRVAAWQSDLDSVKDAFIIMKNAGMPESALSPFTDSPVGDLFPYLYYGKQLDVMKKICVMARKQIEARVRKSPVRADCHIIMKDSPHVVASSL
jgi:hypothetical protein